MKLLHRMLCLGGVLLMATGIFALMGCATSSLSRAPSLDLSVLAKFGPYQPAPNLPTPEDQKKAIAKDCWEQTAFVGAYYLKTIQVDGRYLYYLCMPYPWEAIVEAWEQAIEENVPLKNVGEDLFLPHTTVEGEEGEEVVKESIDEKGIREDYEQAQSKGVSMVEFYRRQLDDYHKRRKRDTSSP